MNVNFYLSIIQRKWLNEFITKEIKKKSKNIKITKVENGWKCQVRVGLHVG